MANVDAVVNWADETLQSANFSDYCPNGLQIKGRDEVKRVVSGVSANLKLIDCAIEHSADLLLVHHGLFWKGDDLGLTPIIQRRLKLLLQHEINLLAYHLPLDAHRTFGNNVLFAQELEAKIVEQPFGSFNGISLGCIGEFSGGIDAVTLFHRVAQVTQPKPTIFSYGPKQIHRIGIISGGGAGSLAEAAELGLDAFICGEGREPSQAEAAEYGIHFVAAGHHATERFGVNAFGEELARCFDISHKFIDVPNPI